MARRKEWDEDWMPTRIDTTIPYKWKKYCIEKRIDLNEVFRIGFLKMTEPKKVDDRIALLESKLNAALKLLEKKGVRVNGL